MPSSTLDGNKLMWVFADGTRIARIQLRAPTSDEIDVAIYSWNAMVPYGITDGYLVEAQERVMRSETLRERSRTALLEGDFGTAAETSFPIGREVLVVKALRLRYDEVTTCVVNIDTSRRGTLSGSPGSIPYHCFYPFPT
jgi:hypothetical protein